jgi:hypothetical protein
VLDSLHCAPENQTKAASRRFFRDDELMASEPSVYYVTEHYVNTPTILVRLDQIGRRSLIELIGMAWSYVNSRTTAKRKS